MALGRGMENDVSFRSGDGFFVKRKVAYVLGFIAVAACVIVGLLVYYAGVMNVEPGCGGVGATVDSLSGKGDKSDEGKAAKKKVTDVRLPTHLLPEKYKVELVPFLVPDNFTIRGHVEITMIAQMDGATNVTLHINDMTLENETITLKEMGTNQQIRILQHVYDKERQFYIAQLDRGIKKDEKYFMVIDFTANLRDGLNGFYRSTYKDESTGEQEYLATTQFQAVDARKAFPCFDEPAMKAKFEISLGRTRDYSSISNMPIREGGKGAPMDGSDDYVWDHYEESVPMSTYLVAFVVSKFGYETSPPRPNNVTFNIWARKDALDQVAYAKDIGAKMLEYFEEYFDVPFPLPKQDMIAIPDFSAGAMENWGLITYRETALLFKEGVSAASNKQRIAIVVSHELAHQWFGNLVTPSWWTDLWLNEGFASYVEYLGVEAIQPQMKLLEQFVYMDLQSVLGIDALETSHPISIPVKHPDEISEIFDRISYAKGASIIRMMDSFLTTDSFRKGLTNYLNDLKYKAAEQDDLWSHLTTQAHQDATLPRDLTVKTVMDTWTLQMGFPVITVTRDYDAKSATLEQDRFLLVKNPDSKDTHDYRWYVPITFTTPGGDWSNTYNGLWMMENEKQKTISGLNDLENSEVPIIFNVQQTGYYRVNYDERNWRLIIDQLNKDHTQIHVINRAQIIDDALNLARAGLLDYSLALGVTEYLQNEVEYIPWGAALRGLSYVDKMLKRTAAYGDFKRYMTNMVEPLFNRVGFEAKANDEHLDVFLRQFAVGWACKLDIVECTDKVKAKYQKWMDQLTPDAEGANPIDVNLKSQVYCNAIRDGNEAEWNFAWERYQKSNVASEKATLLRSLTCSDEVWLLNRYLNWSLTEGSGVRRQDGTYVISGVAGETIGRDLAFDFVRQNFDKILEYYGNSLFSFSGLIFEVTGYRQTAFELSEVDYPSGVGKVLKPFGIKASSG